MGMLKVDVLGLGMLTCIRKCFDLVNGRNGERRKLELHTVPSEDPAVYDMICSADTIGVFQIESRAQMSMLPRLRPRCFYDLVIEVAIVRPGPIQGKMVHPYLRRRKNVAGRLRARKKCRGPPAGRNLNCFRGPARGPIFEKCAGRGPGRGHKLRPACNSVLVAAAKMADGFLSEEIRVELGATLKATL